MACLQASKPLVMGVLNITPDSFSDGGKYVEVDTAVAHALAMIEQGADIIDIGGQSSHPSASPVSADEELSRVMPIIERLRQICTTPLSIDTDKAQVMHEALSAGAGMVNDVSALNDTQAFDVCKNFDVPVCLMHARDCEQENIIDDCVVFFEDKIKQCMSQGLKREHLILDPGFGFNKTVEQNLEIINQFDKLLAFELPLLIGVSRKGSLSKITGCDKADRLWGSLALNCLACERGASLFRVHDVKETVLALKTVKAVIGLEKS